ncbi:MAG: oxidoreductase, partial [Kosmotoga sp.]
GLCRHCTIEKYFVCKDGPVFTYDQFENPEGIWT